MYDLYFWWKGWTRNDYAMYPFYYNMDLNFRIYPPNPSRGWVVFHNGKTTGYSPRSFKAIRAYINAQEKS